ncbi:hypothetical protein MML48_8g00002744 [Holotrichia oblita]|uniref:Uncharacterized protein n=1 Tax=Holotrichia oblita TaxID=644536 RepID=A0ACB9SLP0_HOLOL|nr:hypothetical protein MML48_8g00002744 [Holotrichia oblita]
MSTNKHKRKHTTLTLSVKAEILQRLDQGEKMSDLAKYYGLGRATIFEMKQNRAKIEEFMKNTDFDFSGRRRLKYGDFPQVEEALMQWITHQRENLVQVTGELIQERAKYFYKQIMQKDDFKASNGWLDKFKKRYGIRLSGSTKEKIKAPVEEVTLPAELKKLNDKINELRLVPDQIYNVEISQLFWKSLPTKLCKGNPSKDYISIMPCCNASGAHKLNILVVANKKEPRIIRNLNLPINYLEKTHGYITQEIFTNWFFDHFAPATTEFLIKQRLPQVALLIIHNDLGFSKEDLIHSTEGFFQIMQIPQEEDKMVQVVKDYYRKKFVLNTIAQKPDDLDKYINELSINNSVLNLGYSWRSIPPSQFISSWKTLWPNHPRKNAIFESADSNRIDYKSDLQRTLDYLAIKLTSGNLSADEINEWLNSDTESDINIQKNDEGFPDIVKKGPTDEDEDTTLTNPTCIEYDEAISTFNRCIEWAEQNAVDLDDILTLKRMQEKALEGFISTKKSEHVETLFMEGSVKSEFLVE